MRYCIGELLDCQGRKRPFRYQSCGEPSHDIGTIEHSYMPGSRVLTISLEPTDLDMVVEEQVSITFKRYLELLDAERRLQALEAGGVDNWDGYDWAMESYWRTHSDD